VAESSSGLFGCVRRIRIHWTAHEVRCRAFNVSVPAGAVYAEQIIVCIVAVWSAVPHIAQFMGVPR
jgi:hypothetical protein